MTFRFVRDGVWLALNLATAIVFLWVSSTLWLEPELRDYPGASGGAPVIFTLIVLYLLVPTLLINLVWFGVVLWRLQGRQDWTPVWIFAGLSLGWLGLLFFSASRL